MGKRSGKWNRVSASKPCPVCGSPDWCGVSEDGKVARCMRQASAKESPDANGTPGYIHDLDENLPRYVPDRPQREVKKLTTDELTKLAKGMYEHSHADARRREVARLLGVSVAALESLKVGYGCDRNGREYSSWPARDHRGTVVGIVRRYDDGSKKSYPGGSTGLFYGREWRDAGGPVLIVEGGSDTAAAITAGLSAIGRPSNTGGAERIRAMLGTVRAHSRRAIVIGEADSKPEKRGQMPGCPVDCEGCGVCWPGKAGAILVATQLGCQWVMVPEGSKDFRDALNKGMVWPGLIRAAC